MALPHNFVEKNLHCDQCILSSCLCVSLIRYHPYREGQRNAVRADLQRGLEQWIQASCPLPSFWTADEGEKREGGHRQCPDQHHRPAVQTHGQVQTVHAQLQVGVFLFSILLFFCFQLLTAKSHKQCDMNTGISVNYSGRFFVSHVTNSGKRDTLLFKPSFNFSFTF